jgi:two-component system, cell cycle response regulator DivK
VSRSGASPQRDDDDVAPPSRRPHDRLSRLVRVLIVDDSQDVRELYSLYLTHQGFSVKLASDGVAAVDAAIALKPDVIVMDLSMPTVDGITATRRLKAHPRTRRIPVILLTGYPYHAIERGALEAGVDVFLTKPCLPEDLEGHVRRLMEENLGG